MFGAASRRRVGFVPVFALLAVIVALVSAGCVPRGTLPSPSPTAPPGESAEPIFASDEEALAAATEAYRSYLELSDLILSEGGADPQRIDAVVTGDAVHTVEKDFEAFKSANAKLVGKTNFHIVSLQSRLRNTHSELVTLYLCNDVSEVDVVDAAGVSLVAADRVTVTPFVVTILAESRSQFLLSSKELWTGSDFC